MSASPVTPLTRCLPVSKWPEPDQTAWAIAERAAVNPDQGSIASHWSQATWRMVRGGYGSWLAWLDKTDLLDAAIPAAERVTTERVSSYLAALRTGVGEFTVAARIEQLGNAMRLLAPAQHWHWLQRMADQIRAAAKEQPKRAASAAPARAAAEEHSAAVFVDVTASNRCLPLPQWPEQDQEAWAAALQPGDVLDPGGMASRWAVATQIGVINGYGRWLSWLAGRGLLDPSLSPGARVTWERLRTYAVDLQNTVAPFTVAARIEQVGHALRAMVPHEDWRWIQRAADRLRAQAVSVRDKRARLQSPEQLIGLSTALMAQGDDPASGSPAERAAAYRDGLLIALLAHRPVRARNLTAILCGRHLVCRGGEWWLVFSAAETKTGRKTGQGLEFPFPADLMPALHRYLEIHRPVLLARGTRRPTPVTALWVSKQGTHMSYAAISCQVRQRTGVAFGKSLSPHLFRDAVATGVAIGAPTQMHLVQPLLGHTTQATSERHYNLAGSLEAGRRYEKTIAALRQRPRASKHMTASRYDEARKR